MLKITILLLGLFWCLGLWIEGRDAAKSRATLRHVVHVNGTRGKSTVCRLIEAGLRAGGLRVFCKTTGTDPMTIDVSGNEEPLRRRGKANIKEQVGILRRVVVMDCGDGLIEAINPVIISASGEQGDLEGCLSFPGKSGYVVRPNHVVMRAYDRDGSLIEYEAEGLLARCIMHECDHLDGHVYLEKVTEPPEGFDAGQAEEQE